MAKGVDCVFRLQGARKFPPNRGRRLGKDDHIALWHKPQRPDWMDAMNKDKEIRKILYQHLLIAIIEHTIGNRPVEPREVKRRPKTYQLLLKPRKIAKQKLLARR